MATSDSLHTRYHDDYLGKLERGEGARLVHGMAWLRDEVEPEKPPEVGEPKDDRSLADLADAWFRPSRRAMLAAHGVGTVDQAMLAGMHVKFGFLRLFGLADRVLVIDEVHAYDAYMSAIIARLLQWCACLKIPVILLSATLSAKQRAAMVEAYGAAGGDPGPEAPYPLVTVAERGMEAQTISACASSSKTLKVEALPGLLGDAKKTAAKAAELVKGGGCCCVILNTVKQAQAVYEALKLPQTQKLLFHARFAACDRQHITEKVLDLFGKDRPNRPAKFVLVATQVVEQSLDVDFDDMISEIAPIDLLLQRSGRMHRHRKRAHDPVLRVLLPEQDGKPKFGASEKIYERYPLLRTREVLGGSSEITLPDRFRPLIESVYGDRLPAGASDDLKEARQEWDDLREDLAAQAGEFLLCEPMADEFDPVGADEVGD
jgi:CRISPR-associated endonuclease/helicase Cas3